MAGRVFTFLDLAGAFPGIGAEERGQGEAIAKNLFEMSQLRVPTIATITGEGGSGGALALAVADRVLMLENAIYSVISPEGCASIMWKDATRKQQAAAALRYTAKDTKALGCVDDIISEPEGGSQADPARAFELVNSKLMKHFKELQAMSMDDMLEKRYSEVPDHGALLRLAAIGRSVLGASQQEHRQRLRDIPGTSSSTFDNHPVPRGLQLALCATALVWAVAATAIAQKSARGIAERFQAGSVEALLASVFLLFLAVAGLRALDWIATRGRYTSQVLPLPKRATASAEFGIGAAIGWGLALAAALPLLLTGNLKGRILWQPGSLIAIVLALCTLLMVSLAEEVFFRGYIYRRLSDATGPSWAAALMSILFGLTLVAAHPPPNLLMAFIDCALFGLILTIAYQRTHALWLGWGLHFAYRAAMAVLLGLPIAGHVEYGSIADVLTTGPRWLSGGPFGLDSAVLTSLFLLDGIFVLYRCTRNYAWSYTHAPIVAGGYEVVVEPPKAHVEMEAAAAAGSTLVQILPVTPSRPQFPSNEYSE